MNSPKAPIEQQVFESPMRELSRLAALLRYEILDTPDEPLLDDFTHLAAGICDAPISLISLVDEQRQWFKSRHGLDISETPREISFCSHAIADGDFFEIPDASLDPRFKDNPLVTGEPHIRFYASAPLVSPDGYKLGTLCVIDRKPRLLSLEQRDALSRLSRQVMRLFEERLLTSQYAEQAALHQALLDGAASAVVVTRADGRISRINSLAATLFGYPEEALLGRVVTSVLFALDCLERRAAMLGEELGRVVEPNFNVLAAAARDDRPVTREWRLLHRDGSQVPVLLSVLPINDEHQRPRGYILSAFDLTLQENLQLRLYQITAQVPGMLFQYHWRKGALGSFPYVSEGVQQIYGFNAADVSPSVEPFLERVYPEDRGQLIESIRQAAVTLTPWHLEHRIQHPEKGVLWVEGRAAPLRQPDGSVLWHGLVTDITERKAEQLELDRQQEMNRRLLEALSEGVVACDSDGKLTIFNNTARSWHGLDAHSIAPECWPDFYNLCEADGITPLAPDRVPLMRALRGERIRDAEMSIVRNGQPRHILANGDPMFSSDGNQCGAVVVFHDITERKRIEQLQREFVSTVSHELRTPLTSITASLGLICGKVMGDIPAHLQELLDISHLNSIRLSALIDDLLDIDKLNAGKMRFELAPHSLPLMLDQAMRSNQGYAESHDASIVLTDCAPVEVEVDAMRLQQVLSNLLSNAAKFSPVGGTVELRAERRDTRVRISVRDQGKGIARNFHPRVFQKFAQADASDTRQQGGTGLGLAISKELVERMGGQIGFDSKPDEGACFWFDLPCHEPDDSGQ